MSRMTQTGSSSVYGAARRQRPTVSVLKRLTTVFGLWAMRRRTRKHLSELDDFMLDDIGVTHAQAHKEASRPFWKG
ncbi:DUF1127 domain-containing protein [Pseudodonghicola xiamenensis]|uniref:YjiS-like domain-containing protein n=1 Tax=Pseudodonghicola xiamenensis TaxID=337702 RepID=A0A8J3H2V3_9RHOB|nr:DUF1127 domain-containing protein [Pseudodonghicola xiamenensis]GHG80758.1 hypothetical protein GCM10010961_04180 [Pseudodonghicola xiamenensis]